MLKKSLTAEHGLVFADMTGLVLSLQCIYIFIMIVDL